jgi:hypothetical protein
MEGSPWTVGRHVVLMKKYDVEVQPQMVVFDRFAIWARILALPNRLMNAQRWAGDCQTHWLGEESGV